MCAPQQLMKRNFFTARRDFALAKRSLYRFVDKTTRSVNRISNEGKLYGLNERG